MMNNYATHKTPEAKACWWPSTFVTCRAMSMSVSRWTSWRTLRRLPALFFMINGLFPDLRYGLLTPSRKQEVHPSETPQSIELKQAL